MVDPIPAPTMPLFPPNLHRRVWESLSPEQQCRATLLLADLMRHYLRRRLRRSLVMSKLQASHLARKAMLYIRQSSPYQVQHYTESRQLQYQMRHRLEELGFSEVDVVDEDQGCTAAGHVDRAGFDRMVADVCLGKVGAVAAREVSRFARNNGGLAATRRSLPSRGHDPDRPRHDLLCPQRQ